jgi:hypothetical protein
MELAKTPSISNSLVFQSLMQKNGRRKNEFTYHVEDNCRLRRCGRVDDRREFGGRRQCQAEDAFIRVAEAT